MNIKLKVTALSAAVTMTIGLAHNATAQTGSEVVSSLESKAINATESYIEEAGRSGLGYIFDKAELDVEFSNGKPEFELGTLKAYDNNNANSFLFNQIGINRYDQRTTLNLGLGYRVLNTNNTWMGGANIFYDHEFPNDHKRSSVGVELISSAIQLRGNIYNGETGFITDRSGTDSKALDGNDASFKMALPYLPGAFFEYTEYKWKTVEGAKDAEGKGYSIGGDLSDNLSINFVRTDYDDASKNDINRVQLNYSWNFGGVSNEPTLFEIADKAYQLRKLTTQKYDLVKRENRIVKQKKFGATASGF